MKVSSLYFLWNILTYSWRKFFLALIVLSNCKYWGIEYFNITLEEYKVIYPDGTSDYIKKDDIDGVQVIVFQVNFWRKCKSLSFQLFVFELPNLKMFVLSLPIFTAIVLIMSVLIKKCSTANQTSVSYQSFSLLLHFLSLLTHFNVIMFLHVYFSFTRSIRILCVTQEALSLIESNQQIVC